MMRRTAIATLASTFLASSAAAQTAVQIPLQFDFVNPGAKSLAMGGAFSGIADDATASFANPAGLRELGRAEMSFEVRGRWLESLFLQRGRLSGDVSNERTDVIAGPVFGESPDSSVRIPYISFVLPRPQHGWVIAGFRHELAKVDQSYLSEGVFQKDPAEFTSRREQPQLGVRKVSITHYGAAGAIDLNRRFAVGGTISFYTFDMQSDFRRFDTDGFLGPPILSVERGRSVQQGEDLAVSPSVGVRACWKPCEDRQTTSARFGVVYRHGPTFEFDTESGPVQRLNNRFRLPHVVAAGAAVEIPQSGRRLLLSGEIKRLTYSRLTEDFITDQALDFGIEDQIIIKDGTEFHIGVQYTIEALAWLPRLRAGLWSDPDHTTNFLSATGLDHPELRVKDELMRTALSTGERLTHFSAGVGLTFSPTIEWNFGADFAKRSTIVSASVIVKLGR